MYVKPPGSKYGIVDAKWERHVLHDFGPLKEDYTGTIHTVTCADIDGDGIDELIVSMMGYEPTGPPQFEKSGVWCFKRKTPVWSYIYPY